MGPDGKGITICRPKREVSLMRRISVLVLQALAVFAALATAANAAGARRATRLPENPIVVPASSETLGDNINGPSLIRVPNWVDHPLGRYYLYFAHHGDRKSTRTEVHSLRH